LEIKVTRAGPAEDGGEERICTSNAAQKVAAPDGFWRRRAQRVRIAL
jgi:hypothetical protein